MLFSVIMGEDKKWPKRIGERETGERHREGRGHREMIAFISLFSLFSCMYIYFAIYPHLLTFFYISYILFIYKRSPKKKGKIARGYVFSNLEFQSQLKALSAPCTLFHRPLFI